MFGVPQGSILGPLLINVYICDVFYDINDCDIASYADDNTPYASSSNLDAVINKLGESTNNLFQWFEIITWRLMLTNVISGYRQLGSLCKY